MSQAKKRKKRRSKSLRIQKHKAQTIMISFLICGAQKSGTSALHEYLKHHPEVSLSKTKELHIFDNDNRDWTKVGIEKIDSEIKRYYDCDGINKKIGEATPSSMWWKPAMKRISEYNCEMKLIAILRNPATRAYSNWQMEVNKGREKGKMPLTLKLEEERCRCALPNQHRVYSYLSRGMYTEQIKRIWKYFPRQNLKLIKQESLLEKPSDTLNDIYDFLEISRIDFPGNKNVKSWNSETRERAGKKNANILLSEHEERETMKSLGKIYKDEINMLEKLTGWDCSDWLEITR